MPPKGKLSIPVSFENKDTKIAVQAFMCDTKGNLLQQVEVKDGFANFEDRGQNPKELQFFIAPSNEKVANKVTTMDDLLQLKPFQPSLQFDANGAVFMRPIPDIYSKFWFFNRCRVTGEVSKDFSIDGRLVNKKLCKARVHVCEIDKIWWWLPRIPDDIFRRIPNLVLKPNIPDLRVWPPIPDPIGPIAFDNRFVLNNSLFRNFTSNAFLENIGNINNLNLGGLRPKGPSIKDTLPVLTAEINQAFASANPNLIRSSIAKNLQLLHPYFCLWPWIWPYLYRCTEKAVVYTDANGRFDADIWYWGLDKPDVYIWVEYLIDGVWTTVYRPNIPCNTYWDYACGTDIFVKVKDARVRPNCGDILEGEAVWIRSIGSTNMKAVDQFNNNLTIQGANFNTRGLTTAPWGGLKRSPFGASLALWVKFSRLLPNTNVSYYRWSIQKIANPDNIPATFAGATTTFNNAVSKPYTIEFTDITGTHFTTRQHTLGPVSVGGQNNLYRIPPVSPVGFLGETDVTADYETRDTMSMVFDSKGLSGDGLYMLKLELFDANGVEHTRPANIFQVPVSETDGGNSVNAEPQYINTHGGRNDFQMCIRVDNNQAVAIIDPVKVHNGGLLTAAGPCGFLKYNNAPNDHNIVISFTAFSQNNFADFSFGVLRGNPAVNTVASAGGMVIGNAGRYVRDSVGKYSPTDNPNPLLDQEFTPAELLGPCLAAGGKASFAETLSVWSLATDGYNRLSQYDRHDVASFALEP